MKTKQIEKMLHGIIDNICKEYDDSKFAEVMKKNAYITGGAIPTMILGEYVNDFDIYFSDKASADFIKEYFSHPSLRQTKKYTVKLITDNAINLSDKVQLITRFCGPPIDVVKEFDFAHLKFFYTYHYGLNEDHTPLNVYKLLMEKELVYTGSEFPLSSIIRLKKYIKKGWNVSNKTILHIALDLIEKFDTKVYPEIEDIEDRENKEVPFDPDEHSRTVFEDGSSGEDYEYSVNEVLYHLNGVDPITIQAKLEQQIGKRLSLTEIINLIED